MTRRAWPEAHICCALPFGKGATLTIKARHNSCTLQATLSMQGVIQRFPSSLSLVAVGEAALRYRFSSTTGNPSFGMISGTCWVGSS